MTPDEIRRIIENAGELYGVDADLLGALALVQNTKDDVDTVHLVYRDAAVIHHQIGVFGNLDDALRALASGSDRSRWTDKTEAFLRNVTMLAASIRRDRERGATIADASFVAAIQPAPYQKGPRKWQ